LIDLEKNKLGSANLITCTTHRIEEIQTMPVSTAPGAILAIAPLKIFTDLISFLLGVNFLEKALINTWGTATTED
jgi:hypothetical protein